MTLFHLTDSKEKISLLRAQNFAMSDFSLTLVLHFKTSKNFNGMAKVSIKSEKITPFGGIFHVREHF